MNSLTTDLRRTPEFRAARPEDLQGLLELYGQLHESDGASASEERLQSVWRNILRDERLHCFVLAVGRDLRATCILDIVPNLTRGARPFAVLQNVVTHADDRGTGLGKRLVSETLNFAWKQGCYQVLVQTGRPEVVAFYEKVGFRSDSKIGLVAKPEWRPA
jgi:GNAT superfamily N-acetyltransferase